MRSLEFYLSLKIGLEIIGLIWSLALGGIRPHIDFLNSGLNMVLLFGILLVVDTAFWIHAKKVIKEWDKPPAKK